MKARERYRRYARNETDRENAVLAVVLTLIAVTIVALVMILATRSTARAQDANANCRATADSVVFATGNRQLANRIYLGCRISMPLPTALPRTTGRGGRDVVAPMANALPPPSSNALDDVGNPARNITRAEVESALVDWCSTHADAALCRKLQR